MAVISKSCEIGGRTLTLETGRFAQQADGEVLASYGETMVLATVVESTPVQDLGYFPLTVDYVERLYAGGRIKGSRWVKREGKTSDEGVLIGRLIDRSVRPLFPKEYFNEIQIIVTVLSVDLENNPDVLSVIASSAALAISGVPWSGPVGCVRVGLKSNTLFVNPTTSEREYSDLDLVVSSTPEKIVMIEAGAKEIPEEQMNEGILYGKKEAQKIVDLILALQKEVKIEPRKIISLPKDEDLKNEIKKFLKGKLEDLIRKSTLKKEGKIEYGGVEEEIISSFGEEKRKEISQIIKELFSQKAKEMILAGERPDGRKLDEIREIEIQVGILPRTHGSALFRRGQTQVLSVVTLGTPSLHQLIESAEGEEIKRYMHHYSMPPYSVGETGRLGSPSRREIGHGALAERALEPVIPPEEKFPYTIRVVSEVLSSNGSTSMASVCGSTLSLMDAGVPILNPVSGIAMGLVSNGEDYAILSDIAGIEDFEGEMDFKVAGTTKGITAIQMDVKTPGLTDKIIKETLEKAKKGRDFILEKMLTVIPAYREKISQYAPRVVVLHIETDKIGEIIGPGGRVIRKMMEQTGTQIDIDDDGTVNISGVDDQSVASVVSQIEGLTKEIKVGDVFEGTVKRIQPFGAFVEVLPGRDGLVHISQISSGYIKSPQEAVYIGQKVKVRVMEIDEQRRINLSMLFGEEAKKPERSPETKTPFSQSKFASSRRRNFPSFSRSPFSGNHPKRFPR